MIHGLTNGLTDFSILTLILIVLCMTHVTIAAVTIYLHRCQAHRALTLHPAISHFFRLWLWMTTGMLTREWAAIHRKHHAKVETDDDPHSPQRQGILAVLFGGVSCYVKEKNNPDTIARYGYGTPDDWIENNIYKRFPKSGVGSMLVINLVLFGVVGGGIMWVAQMVWIPFWAAGVINGIGHYWGYRNFQPQDESRNIVPLGLLIGGEELHNNHHAFPTSARLSNRWYEFDIGWLYIRLLEKVGLAKVKNKSPQLLSADSRSTCDLDTLQSIIANRLEVASRFARVMRKTCYNELATLSDGKKPTNKALNNWLLGMESRLTQIDKNAIQSMLEKSSVMQKVAQMRSELVRLWEDRTLSAEQTLIGLREWCVSAEKSGIEALASFARDLRGYRVSNT
ncbi:MAG: fatty acid desaturase [Gammaproteobacteria bacterium WSBS_2016_MAG_OTU1]